MFITLVAGARPNFMKISPIINALEKKIKEGGDVQYRLVHTGQHFDEKMSKVFFQQLGIPEPHINLEAGGGSQAEQTAAIMVKFEKELLENRPDVVLVVGDVTSTLACSIAAKKLNIDVVHVEAGIRSGDMTMPEEINRIVTDSICDHFFTTSQVANSHLLASGKLPEQIHFVGNTMIDTLYQNLDRLVKPDFFDEIRGRHPAYLLLTLHRPSNVDDASKLQSILEVIMENANGLPVIFPVHPRTKASLARTSFSNSDLIMVDPLPYLEFIYMVKHAKAIITDSGGITEEATVLGIPCLTMRDSTERPETISIGTNELIGSSPDKLPFYLQKLFSGNWKKGGIPELWDGKTSMRIVEKLNQLYSPAKA